MYICIGRFPTHRFLQSCSSDLLLSSSLRLSQHVETASRLCSLPIKCTTSLRQQLLKYCRTYSRHSMMATWQWRPMLTLLDLSATLDMVDHAILLHRLKNVVRSSWLYLEVVHITESWSKHFVHCSSSKATPTLVLCGVPQGSVLGLILFLLYTGDLVWLIWEHNLCPHLYVDDTQIYGSCHPLAASLLPLFVRRSCHAWMRLHPGWAAIDFSSTLQRPRCSGVLRIGGNIKFCTSLLTLVMTVFSLPVRCKT